jgi:predicted ribosomally synthesized peptide with nif11-like leader
MALESARTFFEKVKSDESFYNELSLAKSKEDRQNIIVARGLNFTRQEFEIAKSELSDWELTMIEDETSFRSDKRISGLELCCCCGVAGSNKES